MDSPILMTLRNSNLQHTFLVVSVDFFSFFNHSRHASWSARLTMLVLTTTFKCSFKALLTYTTLSSPPTVMASTHTSHWAWMMLLGHPSLEGSTWGMHSLQILEHVDWEIPNTFDTSCVLHPCDNNAIAFNLFSSCNALVGKESLDNIKRNCPKRPQFKPKVRGRILGSTMNYFLQLKVSDENNSKIESKDLSSFKIHFLSNCCNIQAKTWKMISRTRYSIFWESGILSK